MPLLLAHARFEEAHGEHAAAAELCAKAAALRPASLEAALAHVQQARRAGELPRARAAYAAGVAALDGEPLAFFALHGARFERRAGNAPVSIDPALPLTLTLTQPEPGPEPSPEP